MSWFSFGEKSLTSPTSPKKRFRTFHLVVVCLFLGISVLLFRFLSELSAPGISKYNFRKIKLGMSKEEVMNILGDPKKTPSPFEQIPMYFIVPEDHELIRWRNQSESIVVWFDGAKQVVNAHYWNRKEGFDKGEGLLAPQPP